jgi:hypothetical protein
MPPGKIQLWEREDFIRRFSANDYQLLDDEALDMRNGVEITRCIKRPDGIHISAEREGIHYEIHFDPQNQPFGHYEVSHGPYAGRGRVVDVRQPKTSSAQHYFYVKVVSDTAHHFEWRIAFDTFTAVTDEV